MQKKSNFLSYNFDKKIISGLFATYLSCTSMAQIASLSDIKDTSIKYTHAYFDYLVKSKFNPGGNSTGGGVVIGNNEARITQLRAYIVQVEAELQKIQFQIKQLIDQNQNQNQGVIRDNSQSVNMRRDILRILTDIKENITQTVGFEMHGGLGHGQNVGQTGQLGTLLGILEDLKRTVEIQNQLIDLGRIDMTLNSFRTVLSDLNTQFYQRKEEIRRAYEQKEQSLNQQKNSLGVTEKERTVRQTEDQYNSLSGQLNVQQKDLNEKIRFSQNFQNEITQLRNRMSEVSNAISANESRVGSLTQEKDAALAAKNTSGHQNKIDEMTAEVNRLEVERAVHIKTLGEYGQYLSKLGPDFQGDAETNKIIANAYAEEKRLRDIIHDLEVRRNNLGADPTGVAYQQVEARYNAAVSELAQMRKRLTDLQQQEQNYMSQQNSLPQQIQSLQQSVDQMKVNLFNLSQSLESLKHQLQSARQSVQQYQEDLNRTYELLQRESQKSDRINQLVSSSLFDWNGPASKVKSSANSLNQYLVSLSQSNQNTNSGQMQSLLDKQAGYQVNTQKAQQEIQSLQNNGVPTNGGVDIQEILKLALDWEQYLDSSIRSLKK